MHDFEDILIYDCEIINALPQRDQAPIPGIKYCQSWTDFDGMGIACICAWSGNSERYHVYLADNLPAFQSQVDDHKTIVGFNSLSFDDRLCAAHGLKVVTSYDILVEAWTAAGLSPRWENDGHHGRYSLDVLSRHNSGRGKAFGGASAPILWQQGKYGQVIDYCLHDVLLTRDLLLRANRRGPIAGPNGDLYLAPLFYPQVRTAEAPDLSDFPNPFA